MDLKRAVFHIHGKGGSTAEAERFWSIYSGIPVLGVDYSGEFPYEVAPQIATAYDEARQQYSLIVILANSIGAYFTMLNLERSHRTRRCLCCRHWTWSG